MRIRVWFNLLEVNNQNALYTQVSRGNVLTRTSVRAAILKNLKYALWVQIQTIARM